MPTSEQRNILVTGAAGQIGTDLTTTLRERFGNQNVVAMGRKTPMPAEIAEGGPCVMGDVTDIEGYHKIVDDYQIDTVYHLAAILSGTGESNPQLCYDVNLNGLYNVLEVAKERGQRLFCPSSIAVFGPGTPLENTPQETVLKPTTMYGVTKVAGELLCDYYFHKYGIDVRGIRYPGLISWKTRPTGGTTDYAVEIYYEAVLENKYECFVGADTKLPMMYMPDAIKGTLDLMDAPLENLKHHSDFNFAGMSFSAQELAECIGARMLGFECTFKPDSRQNIADSWPDSIDDSAASEEWGWKPSYDLEKMSDDMLKNLKRKLG
ncbi:MAG: UDP-glucose 4-epimerase [Methanobacteriota archaeon]|jgi:nucleoside-diphosphate-sugar epimerase|uniref:NAD-dependent epimerase/dehydratase family protein n=1 Tax=Marine Group III euryarchaeote TaxID=2173149 RepID=A0A7J4GUB0_9ARCH|nr:MAG: UDP-glucose 4-epimerase [Euryarchaeota archaeon]HIF37100.1 NAD-dependent epimerase/dehydratase family protein [Marine Group III euryarchaeote]